MSYDLNENLVQQLNAFYAPKSLKRDSAMDAFNMMRGPSVYQLIPPDVVEHIHQYVISPMNNKTAEKIQYIDFVLSKYGFKRFGGGTNRVVYRYYEDQSFCLKVAFDKTGSTNNSEEFKNQEYLKPFVNKIFSVSQCGTIATCERVVPIKSREEFIVVAEEIFDVLVNRFIGKYILEDIGTEYFKNWGLRKGFGPVLLDYPYIYEVDVNDLYCNTVVNGMPCGGPIDYDDGFNYLYCTRCGKRHMAKQIGKSIKDKVLRLKGEFNMKCIITLDGRTFETEAKPKIEKAIDFENKDNKKKVNDRPSRFKFITKVNGVKYGVTRSGEYIKLGEPGTTSKEQKRRANMEEPFKMINNKRHFEETNLSYVDEKDRYIEGVEKEEADPDKNFFLEDNEIPKDPIQVTATINSNCELKKPDPTANVEPEIDEEATAEAYSAPTITSNVMVTNALAAMNHNDIPWDDNEEEESDVMPAFGDPNFGKVAVNTEPSTVTTEPEVEKTDEEPESSDDAEVVDESEEKEEPSTQTDISAMMQEYQKMMESVPCMSAEELEAERLAREAEEDAREARRCQKSGITEDVKRRPSCLEEDADPVDDDNDDKPADDSHDYDLGEY